MCFYLVLLSCCFLAQRSCRHLEYTGGMFHHRFRTDFIHSDSANHQTEIKGQQGFDLRLPLLATSNLMQNKLKIITINDWNKFLSFQRTQAPRFHENCSAAGCFCSWHVLIEPKPYLRADQRECVYPGSWETKQTRVISSGLSGPVWVAENFESKSSLSKWTQVIWTLKRACRVKTLVKDKFETACDGTNISSSRNFIFKKWGKK